MRRTNLKREDGVAMTEFALIVPVFMLIVAGCSRSGASSSTGSRRTTWRARPRAGPSSTATRTAPGQTLQQHARAERHDRVRERREGVHRLPGTARRRSLGEPLRVRIQKPFNFLPILEHRDDHDPRLLDDADRATSRTARHPTQLRRPAPRRRRDVHMSRLRDERGGVLVHRRRDDPRLPAPDGARRRRRQLVHAQAPAPEPRRRGARSPPASSTRRTGRHASRRATPPCKASTARTIADAARQYAGDPEASDYAGGRLPATLHNTEIANQAKPRRRHQLNDAGLHGRHRLHRRRRLATVAEPVLPAPDRGRHLAGRGTGPTSGSRSATSRRSSAPIGLPLSRNGARARVEIRPAISGHRSCRSRFRTT